MSTEAWETLRARVLASPDLTAELWRLSEPAAFRARLNELGAPAEGSWPWDGGPLMLPPRTPARLLAGPPPGPGWTVSHLDQFASPPTLHWRQTGGQTPVAPFYASDLQIWSRHPLNRFLDLRTPLTALDGATEGAPAGLIFHMSRCGSTLVSRMLAQVDGVLAFSEPPVLGNLLRARRFNPALSEADCARWLRAAVGILVQAAGGGETVVKLEAGAMLHLPLLRLAFPRTPWIFLHRDPVDVLLSQARERSSEMLAGVVETALPLPLDLAPDDYCARTLGAICDAAAEGVARAGGTAIAYESLPKAVETVIGPLFGLSIQPADQMRMARITTQNARRGDQPFVDDRAARRAGAGDEIRALAARWVAPALAALGRRV
jgi:hypothetical protein